ncbi:MAG: hypothetical protein EHM70_12065 [Chloroflexota bacterium]|nr:MAG: hypothetical protein EHM70_12065 [Chloroflexota bacterium]
MLPVIAVSRRLGHARASITLDVYGHLIPSMQADVADQIDDLVTPVELGPLLGAASPVQESEPQDPEDSDANAEVDADPGEDESGKIAP